MHKISFHFLCIALKKGLVNLKKKQKKNRIYGCVILFKTAIKIAETKPTVGWNVMGPSILQPNQAILLIDILMQNTKSHLLGMHLHIIEFNQVVN
jgi:hypothetical protein